MGTGRWVINFTINSNLSSFLFPIFRNEINHINSFNTKGKYGKRSYEFSSQEIVGFKEVGINQRTLKSTVDCMLKENRYAEKAMNHVPPWDRWS